MQDRLHTMFAEAVAHDRVALLRSALLQKQRVQVIDVVVAVGHVRRRKARDIRQPRVKARGLIPAS